MEAEVPTVLVGAILTRLTAPPQPPRFFTGRMPFLKPNQQHQSTEGTKRMLKCLLKTTSTIQLFGTKVTIVLVVK